LRKVAFLGATVIIVVAVILIELLLPEIAGVWSMGLLLVVLVLAYIGVRQEER
jgi:hypothetical protein